MNKTTWFILTSQSVSIQSPLLIPMPLASRPSPKPFHRLQRDNKKIILLQFCGRRWQSVQPLSTSLKHTKDPMMISKPDRTPSDKTKHSWHSKEENIDTKNRIKGGLVVSFFRRHCFRGSKIRLRSLTELRICVKTWPREFDISLAYNERPSHYALPGFSSVSICHTT